MLPQLSMSPVPRQCMVPQLLPRPLCQVLRSSCRKQAQLQVPLQAQIRVQLQVPCSRLESSQIHAKLPLQAQRHMLLCRLLFKAQDSSLGWRELLRRWARALAKRWPLQQMERALLPLTCSSMQELLLMEQWESLASLKGQPRLQLVP